MAMNVGSAGDEADVMIDINTTPLIDVMLVLLVMLIITIPIQLHAVNLNLPTGRVATAAGITQPAHAADEPAQRRDQEDRQQLVEDGGGHEAQRLRVFRAWPSSASKGVRSRREAQP